MQESKGLWNEEQLLTEMERMQDQIDSLIEEKGKWKETALQRQQTISDLYSQISLLKSELQKSSEKIVRLNEADLVLEENEKLKEANNNLRQISEKAKEEAGIMVRNYKEEYENKEAILTAKLAKAEEKTASANVLLEEAQNRIRKEVQRKNSYLERQYMSRVSEIEMEAKRCFLFTKTGYQLLFAISCIYGIMITILTALKSEEICADANAFFAGIMDGTITMISGIDFLADILASISRYVPNPLVRMIVSGLVYVITTAGIYAVIFIVLLLPIKKYIRFFAKRQADEYTLFMAGLSIAVSVFYGKEIKGMTGCNLIATMILLFMGCMVVRGVLDMENSRIRKGIVFTAGILIGSIAGMAVIIKTIGIGGIIAVPIAMVILVATSQHSFLE